jgi:hypothetical protein
MNDYVQLDLGRKSKKIGIIPEYDADRCLIGSEYVLRAAFPFSTWALV